MRVASPPCPISILNNLHALLNQGRTVTEMPFVRAEHASSLQN
jgi:hypothetical protein